MDSDTAYLVISNVKICILDTFNWLIVLVEKMNKIISHNNSKETGSKIEK